MDLFDIIEREELKDTKECRHKLPPAKHPQWWEKTLTVWPGETCERMTWTCKICGEKRGRA